MKISLRVWIAIFWGVYLAGCIGAGFWAWKTSELPASGSTDQQAAGVKERWKDFATLAGLAFTTFGSFMTFIISSVNLDYGERLKRWLAVEKEAYQRLLPSAYDYYRAVSALKRGNWDADAVSQARDSVERAGEHLLGADESLRILWFSFTQAGSNIQSEVGDLGDPQQGRDYWNTNEYAKEFDEAYGELLRLMNEKLRV